MYINPFKRHKRHKSDKIITMSAFKRQKRHKSDQIITVSPLKRHKCTNPIKL